MTAKTFTTRSIDQAKLDAEAETLKRKAAEFDLISAIPEIQQRIKDRFGPRCDSNGRMFGPPPENTVFKVVRRLLIEAADSRDTISEIERVLGVTDNGIHDD